MIKVRYWVFLLGFSAILACDKDDNCDNLATNIIGTWGFSYTDGTIEFKSDGTYVDDGDNLVSGYSQGSGGIEKTYTVNDDEIIALIVDKDDRQLAQLTLPVVESTCEEITISLLGLEGKFIRQ